jgi:hypothetical protein
MSGMYIIAIGWLWVVLLMAITESNVVAGVLTLTFYGLLPCALLMWLLGTPSRRARNRAQAASEEGGLVKQEAESGEIAPADGGLVEKTGVKPPGGET